MSVGPNKGRTVDELDEAIRWLMGVEDPLMRKIRYLDKLARGKPLAKVLRSS
ncbi:DUF2200 family protein [Spelaeicoccus albus]|uniref:Uncharacterized protein n=1 Tax=Spelaeicoccus albus TaxID=1280376 RepID=A0A7Z0D528_9MICO|nr:DUF2200 family protein [Spelaeicoccus albus]NYI69026.1 hypothetical protein [Spelaeicoccus albus]